MDKQQTPSPRVTGRTDEAATPQKSVPQQAEEPQTAAEREEKRARRRRLRRHGQHSWIGHTQNAHNHGARVGRVSSSSRSRRALKHGGMQSSRAAKICRRVVAPILTVAAIVCGVFGWLSAGPWKPNPVATATATIATQYGATDPGVLPLVNTRVAIAATASHPFCLAVASAQDADGWLASTRYTRVTGLTDWTHLQTRSTLLQASADESESDSVSEPTSPKDANPEQPLERNTSVAFKDSDLWRTVRCARSVSMTWTGDRNSHDVIIIDTQTSEHHSNPVTLSLSWKRTDTSNTPRIFGVCALLLLLAAILFATVFSLAPYRRRKAKRLIDAERDPASSEGTDVKKVAGEDAPRWVNDHILSRRKREGRRRHAGRSASAGSASRHEKKQNGLARLSAIFRHSKQKTSVPSSTSLHPAVSDVGNANMVARLQQQNRSHTASTATPSAQSTDTGITQSSSLSGPAGSTGPINPQPASHHPTDADVREYLRRLSQEELGTSGLERDQGLDADTHFFAPIQQGAQHGKTSTTNSSTTNPATSDKSDQENHEDHEKEHDSDDE
jgi:hypothetical protein